MKIEEDNRIFFEDALLTRKILWAIENFHQLHVNRIYRHVKINGLETDAVAVCQTAEDRYERWVGFELKENAIEKAIQQAIARRKYFDYFYIVIDWHTSSIVKWILKYHEIEKMGIGVISSHDDVVVLKSNFMTRKIADKKVEIYP
ncbi:MAG: hypothetical protein FE045_03305, partial [Thermoplasmata archaeon]